MHMQAYGPEIPRWSTLLQQYRETQLDLGTHGHWKNQEGDDMDGTTYSSQREISRIMDRLIIGLWYRRLGQLVS